MIYELVHSVEFHSSNASYFFEGAASFLVLVRKIETFATRNKIETFGEICNEKGSVKFIVLFDIFDVNREIELTNLCLILFYICHCKITRDKYLSRQEKHFFQAPENHRILLSNLFIRRFLETSSKDLSPSFIVS